MPNWSNALCTTWLKVSMLERVLACPPRSLLTSCSRPNILSIVNAVPAYSEGLLEIRKDVIEQTHKNLTCYCLVPSPDSEKRWAHSAETTTPALSACSISGNLTQMS